MLFWIVVYVACLFLLAQLLYSQNYTLKPKALLSGMSVCLFFGAFSYWFVPSFRRTAFLQLFVILYFVKCLEYFVPQLYLHRHDSLFLLALALDRLIALCVIYLKLWRHRNDNLDLSWDTLKRWDRQARA